MNFNAKVAVIAASVSVFAGSSIFAASPSSISFSNEVRSDVASIWTWKGDDDDFEAKGNLANVYNQTVAEYDGGVLKLGVDVTFAVTREHYGQDDYYFKVDWTNDSDYFIEFQPWDIVSLGLSRELYTLGSYLPVLDDNISGGNYGTNGFAFFLKPVEGLTFGAGFDYASYWDVDDEDDAFDDNYSDIALALGVDYTQDGAFSIGGSVHHVTNDDKRQVGIYASILSIDKLGLYFGLTHNEDSTDSAGLDDVDFVDTYYYWSKDNTAWYPLGWYSGICGNNIANVGITYEFAKFGLKADAAINFDHGDSFYDFYTAVELLFGLNSNLGLDIKGLLLADLGKRDHYDDELASTVGVLPKLVYTTGKHTLTAGLKIQHKGNDDVDSYNNSYTYFGLPVSWKYEY